MVQNLHILLVENNEIDQLYISYLLSHKMQSPVDLKIATSLSGALQMSIHLSFDVVLLNIGLLNSQRAKTISALIDIYDDAPIIILAGSHDMQLSEDALLLGAQDYLVKSEIKANVLEKTIQTAIVRKQVEKKRIVNIARQYEDQNSSQTKSFRMNLFRLLHDQIREPVIAILSSTSIMQIKGDVDSADVRPATQVERIKNAGQLIAEFLDNIMAIDYSQSGKLQLRPELVNLEDYMSKNIRAFKYHQEVQHRITLRIDSPFHQKIEEIGADRIFLGEILRQLLLNATIYSPNEAKIDVEVYYDDFGIVLGVRDEGIGMTYTEQNYIFDFGYRSKRVEKLPGLGLGLTIVQEIINIYGGEIEIESQMGVGSYFRVHLPILKVGISDNSEQLAN